MSWMSTSGMFVLPCLGSSCPETFKAGEHRRTRFRSGTLADDLESFGRCAGDVLNCSVARVLHGEQAMIYAFDDFELDPGQIELRRNGVPVHVEPQVFALLVLLVENRERMVSKDE